MRWIVTTQANPERAECASNISSIPSRGGFLALGRAKPELYKAISDVANLIMRSDGVLSGGERELVASYVSRLNHCAFCCDAHTATAQELGYADAANLLDHPDDKLKALFTLAEKVVRRDPVMERGDVEAAIAAGWSEAAVEETIHVAALFSFFNCVVDAYGLQATPAEFAQYAKFLAKNH